MSTLKELREKRARLVAEARERMDLIKDDTPEARRTELEAAHDAAMKEYDATEAEIQRRERVEAMEAAENERRERETEQQRQQRRPGDDASAPGAATTAKPSLRSAFKNLLLKGMGQLSEEERAVLRENGAAPDNSPEARALTTGTGSSGGYTVPTEFLPQIEKTMAIWGPMLNPEAVDILTTDDGSPIEFPSIDDTAQRGDQFAENAAITDDGGVDPAFGQITLSAYMHNSEIVRVPVQLMSDSAFDVVGRLLPDLFGERMARTANDKLTTADGSSKPQGITIGAGAGVTAASQTAFAADELIDLQHTVNPAYRASPKAAWMFNDTVLKMIRKLKDSENRYIWQAPDIKTGEPATLLGNRYWINPSMASPATGTRPIVYGDLSKYMVRRVGGFTLFVFRERYMDNLQLGVMSYGRFDGKVINTAAVKRLTMAAA